MVIIVGYKKRVGKDEFYKIVKRLYPNKRVIRMAFADALKDEIYEQILKPNNLDRSVMENEETKAVMRPMMQWWGTQFKRNPLFGGRTDHWIDQVIKKIKNYCPSFWHKIREVVSMLTAGNYSSKNDCIFIICDGRFANEITKVKRELRAHAVHIVRDSVFDPNETHISETELDSHLHLFDHTIENNGTLEEYGKKIEALIDSLILAENTGPHGF
jgi:hypothetical protein